MYAAPKTATLCKGMKEKNSESKIKGLKCSTRKRMCHNQKKKAKYQRWCEIHIVYRQCLKQDLLLLRRIFGELSTGSLINGTGLTTAVLSQTSQAPAANQRRAFALRSTAQDFSQRLRELVGKVRAKTAHNIPRRVVPTEASKRGTRSYLSFWFLSLFHARGPAWGRKAKRTSGMMLFKRKKTVG